MLAGEQNLKEFCTSLCHTGTEVTLVTKQQTVVLPLQVYVTRRPFFRHQEGVLRGFRLQKRVFHEKLALVVSGYGPERSQTKYSLIRRMVNLQPNQLLDHQISRILCRFKKNGLVETFADIQH